MRIQRLYQIPGYSANVGAAAAIAALAIAFLATILVTPALSAQEFTQLVSFTGPNGNSPNPGVTLDAAGNVYGTTYYGGRYGTFGGGTVFKLSRSGSGWTLSSLYDFSGQIDGRNPWGGVVFGPDGALYGATSLGGLYGHGLVYKLQPPPNRCSAALCYWTETVLYNFTGAGGDGAGPQGNLIFDRAGNLYGTTYYGGQGSNGGNGTVYELSPSHGSWNISILYAFTGGADGSDPGDGVVLDQAGNIYGTASYAGAYNLGVVYELTHGASGWTETVLHDFAGGSDGKFPTGLVLDSSGNVYGATFEDGGLFGGTVYELQPSGGTFTYNIIYTFNPDLVANPSPGASLTLDRAGNLYGTGGGATGGQVYESIFELTSSGGIWNLSSLWNLNVYQGLYPGTPVFDTHGNIYGTMGQGGQGYYGTAWEVTP